MKRSFFLSNFVVLLLCLTACQALKQAKTLSKCTFTYAGITNFSIADVKFDGKTNIGQIGMIEVAQILAAINNNTAKISFDIKLDINNPGQEIAVIKNMPWKVLINDQELLKGNLSKPVTVQAHSTTQAVLCAHLSLEDKTALSNINMETIWKLYKTFKGESSPDEELPLKLQIKPTINNFTVPTYITVYPRF